MKTRVAVLALAIAAGAVFATDDYPVLVYPCYRAEPAPVLDGQPNDACWAKAPLVGGFIHYNKPEVVDVQTFFRVLADDQALYIAVQCDEPLAKKLVKANPGHKDDHAAVFAGEAVELFLDPAHDHATYYQIALSLSASIYDGKGTETSWNSDTKVATAVNDQGWSAEVAIPWADLGVKQVKPGQVVGFNICRDRNISDDKQWTTWSRVDANFHDRAHFGHLVLFPTVELIGSLTSALRLGDRQGPLQVFVAEGFSGATYLALAKGALKQLDAAIAELDDMRKKEPADVADVIGKRIAAANETVAPFRQKIEAGTPLDAAEWLRADSAMTQLSTELRNFVWQARLKSLLSSI